ncbi:MAG: glycosyltransferase family 4 protein [Planctomycetes bacterium]|nr:glycosyltransferase family 4 protein [Planctomycetota bacterium]
MSNHGPGSDGVSDEAGGPASGPPAGPLDRPGAPLTAAFVSGDPGSASARVRVLDHLPGLAARGITGELLALPRGPLARRRLFAGLSGRDVVVLGRRLLGEGDLVALRRAARALVLDLDDALWARPFRPGGRRGPARLADALRAVDLVVVGSGALRDELRGRHPRVRVLASSTPAPASSTPELEPRPAGPEVRLVWTGSRSTLPYLEGLGPVLRALAREAPVALEVVADAPPDLPGVPVTFTPWSLPAEEAALRRADVGLYPLAGDAWSRGKCAYKLLRYMAFGLPSVASRAGAGLETLDPPEAGLVADDEGEWLRALRTLAGDPALRRRMGVRARGLSLARDGHLDRTRSLERILREAARIGRDRGLHRPATP